MMRRTRIIGALLAALCVAPLSARALDIERVITPKGIEVWFVESHHAPMLALSVAWEGGSRDDRSGREGTVAMMSALLDEGAGRLDAARFQEKGAALGAEMEFEAYRDSVYGRLTTLAANAQKAFALFRLASAAPRFDKDALERVRAQTLSALALREQSPGRLASRAWFDAAFGAHPYAHPPLGRQASIARISRDDIARAHRRMFVRKRMVVGVVGAITAAELMPLIDRTFGALPKGRPAKDAPPLPAWKKPLRVHLPRAGAQTTIRFGLPGLTRSDADFMPAYIMTHILGGGGFTSRLMEEARTKRGLVYGISAWLVPLRWGDILLGQAATKNASAEETLALIREVIGNLRKTPPSEDELKRAKATITSAYWLGLDTSPRIAGHLVYLQREGFGIDYPKRREALINAVSRADIARVARRLLKPNRLIISTVGGGREK